MGNGGGKVEDVERIRLGRWTKGEVDRVLSELSEIHDAGGRIALISSRFIGVPYAEGTLTGNSETPEVFTINLAEVDCFTYLDYVEAMRLSTSFEDFREALRRIRYRGGRVDFFRRNHFFSDWREANRRSVADVTRDIAGGRARLVTKVLNLKEDGTAFLPGIKEHRRRLSYLPSAYVPEVIDRFVTGDYAGIYTENPGLDVSHTGIIVRRADRTLLRHASSLKRKVIEEDLAGYVATKPGLIILRPRP